MKVGAKSLMFLVFIFAIFGIEYARRKYLETKNENEGFSKASDAAKMSGKIALFIILIIVFYAIAFYMLSNITGGGGGPDAAILLPVIGGILLAPGTLAYYLAFVLIN